MKNNLKYFAFYIFGVALGLLVTPEKLSQSLSILEPVILTALIASFLVPFAGFSSNEHWNKFLLQYAVMPIFGIYTIAMWNCSSYIGIILFIFGALIHFAYWQSSLHSRNYRLKQFQLGFGSLAKTLQAIAMLNGTGKAHLADELIVTRILKGEKINFEKIKVLLPEVLYQEIMAEHGNQ